MWEVTKFKCYVAVLSIYRSRRSSAWIFLFSLFVAVLRKLNEPKMSVFDLMSLYLTSKEPDSTIGYLSGVFKISWDKSY